MTSPGNNAGEHAGSTGVVYNTSQGVAAGSGQATSATGPAYSYSSLDPYTLGNLAQYPVVTGTVNYPASAGRLVHVPAAVGNVIGGYLPREDQGEHGGGGDSLQRVGAYGAGTKLAKTSATKLIDEFLTLYGTDRSKFNALRTALAQAGYYGATPLDRVTGRASGLWDVNAFKYAIRDWVTQTTRTNEPLSIFDFLAGGGGQNSAANSAAGGAAAPPTIQLTDPAALEQTLQGVARAQLGRELSPDQLSAFVSAFHSQETAVQSAPSTGGGTVTRPDPTSDALQYVEQNYGGQQGQHEAQGYTNALLNLFLPSGAQRPGLNTNPLATSA